MQYQNIELHNVHELVPRGDGGMVLRRIPRAVAAHLSKAGAGAASNNVGVELRFVPEGEVEITLSTTNEKSMDHALVYYGSVQSGWETLEAHITGTPKAFTFRPSPRVGALRRITEERHLPFSPDVVRVLVGGNSITLHDVKGACRPPRAGEVPEKTGVFYGSSITNGSLACKQNLYWTLRVANALGVDQENCGLAGSCRMEKEMADWLAAREDWDFAVLEMGINVLGEYDETQFRERVRYQLHTLHAAHPGKYLFCTDIFYYRDDLLGSGAGDMYRRVVAEEVAALGSDRVVHLSGLRLLTDMAGLSEDLVHPSIEGVLELTQRFSEQLRPYIEKL